ncbi:MAG: type II secretion system protein M [Alphaproteobacteria bacterium]|nr:type II secretion system protein M [Alphaproteobacteria bacterium]
MALLVVVVLWLGVIRPIDGSLVSAKASHAAAIDRYAAIRARVDAIKGLSGHRPPALGAPLDVVVSQSASETGFTLDRNDPQGEGRVSIAIGSARPTAFFGWLASLEALGVQVETLSARPAGPDVISATAVLRTAGR